MIWLLALPVAIPLLTAFVAFLLRRSAWGARVSVAGSGLALLAAVRLTAEVWDEGVIAGQSGGWPAPYGITLVADLFSAAMVLVTAVIALSVAVYALADVDSDESGQGFHALFQVLIAGVTGSFVTGDLFNLYVWFEVMLIASFGLLVLGGRTSQIRGAVTYVVLNISATVVLLIGVGLLYGVTGTLNMADLALTVDNEPREGLLTVVAMTLMVAFGIKAGLFPLFFWLPASYHTPAFGVSAVFAGLLTKVGVYALIRTFTLIFDHDTGYTHGILLWVAGATMITGVLGAAAQNEMRRILSFHIVSQIGYMILGLALLTPLALTGAVFYIVHHIVVKANLFLIAGAVARIGGSTILGRVGGLYAAAPGMAVLFLIPAFSLAGFPPLSGFWAKFALVRASIEEGLWLAAGTALVVGLLTVYSMTKIWDQAFWTPHPEGTAAVGRLGDGGWALLAPIIALATITVLMGAFPQPFLAFAERAAAQLLDNGEYVAAVLGAGR